MSRSSACRTPPGRYRRGVPPSTLAGFPVPSPHPLITYYDLSTGERVELSGATAANWVAKVAGFLTEELDAGRGTRIRIGLPSHWLRCVWLLGAWRIGAVVTDTDATIGLSGPELEATEPIRLAGALRPLGGRFVTPPSGFVDIAEAVPPMPDVFVDLDPPAPSDPALDLAGRIETHASLLARPAVADRIVQAPASVTRDAQTLAAVLAGGGSWVIVNGPAADLAAIADQERGRIV